MFRYLLLCLSVFGIATTIDAKQETVDIEVLSWSPRIILLRNFLNQEECDHLISQAKPYLKRSQVIADDSGDGEIHEARTSKGMFFESRGSDSIITQIEERISHLMMMPVENGEIIQVLHYEPGAEFKPHYDYFNHKTTGGQLALKNGGQRMATLIMYLNTTEEGGETIFPEANLQIIPKKGNAILFYNCQPDGKEDPLTLHGGAPILKGNKWIATKWIHFQEVR